ncbi:SigB/SigF/SigG family RNA polymerase sigma factor [Actinomadura rudentiformis]|uniref:SigB/SigF/SigG family RNA polymerase sigma factor n=1 Tax=Actinomadura rudentiformis TaxID=359158 RepID=A0A6H9YP37_9ACTN|nr:SigB/SigF/SigG family RNA polymerase sigma factor [Actinomadura rudentiformis]KAB2345207.1 SigB/SigF/SigG family RNA polymerase sigma factor [Actinomadura rudentiformis]
MTLTADLLVDERTADDRAADDQLELFRRLRRYPEGHPEWWRIREEIFQQYLPLVRGLAGRFAQRGELKEDLQQVGMVGLVKAVNRFDPGRGIPFEGYATPTILGEIKRHFRDRGWAIRPPRTIQELRNELNKARADLTQRLGRSPRVSELAEHTGRDPEEVIEAIAAGEAYQTRSFDQPAGEEDEGLAYADLLGYEDEQLNVVEYREALKAALARLPARERRIVLLRFYGNRTQSQIAEEIGVSQMHVSRLLSRSLAQLRVEVGAAPATGR